MEVDFNTKRHQLSGRQILEFTNNSPDTLHKVFYHLYFNAFQPNSVMDVRSRTIADPDKRVGDRISKLKNGEQGFRSAFIVIGNRFIVENNAAVSERK